MTVDIDEAFEAAYETLTADNPTDDGAGTEPEMQPEEADTPADDDTTEDLTDEDPGGDDDADPEEDVTNGEDDPDTSDAVPVDIDNTYTLPDGTVVTGAELKDGWLRQSDYTQKTQALAEERRQFEADTEEIAQQIDQFTQWYEQNASTPEAIANHGFAQVPDKTAYIAELIANHRDELDPSFLQVFGLDKPDNPVDKKAADSAYEKRIAALEAKEREQAELTDKQKAEQQRQLQTQQAAKKYVEQWDAIKQAEGLTSVSQDEEMALRKELVDYAREHRVFDLNVAWNALQREKQQKQAAEKTEAAKRRATASTARSRPTGNTSPAPAKTWQEAMDMAAKDLESKYAG